MHKARRVKLAGYFGTSELCPGTVVGVRITKPAFVGKDFTFTTRKSKFPTRTTRCPGAGRFEPGLLLAQLDQR